MTMMSSGLMACQLMRVICTKTVYLLGFAHSPPPLLPTLAHSSTMHYNMTSPCPHPHCIYLCQYNGTIIHPTPPTALTYNVLQWDQPLVYSPVWHSLCLENLVHFLDHLVPRNLATSWSGTGTLFSVLRPVISYVSSDTRKGVFGVNANYQLKIQGSVVQS